MFRPLPYHLSHIPKHFKTISFWTSHWVIEIKNYQQNWQSLSDFRWTNFSSRNSGLLCIWYFKIRYCNLPHYIFDLHAYGVLILKISSYAIFQDETYPLMLWYSSNLIKILKESHKHLYQLSNIPEWNESSSITPRSIGQALLQALIIHLNH